MMQRDVRLRLRPHYVYRCFDLEGRLLYVGCSVVPVVRVQQHRELSWWGGQIASVRNLVFADRDAALARERAAIRMERPRWNVKGRWLKADDRESWTVQDYADFCRAVVQAVETTHGVYGVMTRRLIRDSRDECLARFGMNIAERAA